MDVDPTSQEYRDMKRMLFASAAGGEEALFLSKIEQHLPNADFRLKHKLGISDESLEKLLCHMGAQLGGMAHRKKGWWQGHLGWFRGVQGRDRFDKIHHVGLRIPAGDSARHQSFRR